MSAKIPPDAFEYYLGLGPGRSYGSVAEEYSVTKRAVTKLAARGKWQERILEIERKARRASDDKAAETLEQMNDRHLKSLRVIQGKALEALKAMPLNTAMEGARCLDLGIKQERVIRGEPSDRSALTVEEKIRSEYENWLTPQPDDDTEDANDDDENPDGDPEQGKLLP